VFKNVSGLQTSPLGAAAAGVEERMAGQQAEATVTQTQVQRVVVGTAVANVPVAVPVTVVANGSTTTNSSESAAATAVAATATAAAAVEPTAGVGQPSTASSTASPNQPAVQPAAPILVTPAALPGLPTGIQATGPLILQQGGAFGGALMYTTGIPQAPATFVVDTSETAMAMDGIQQTAPAPRSRSAPRKSPVSSSSSNNSNSAPNGNVKVTIIKQGAP
jgi:hypothetical protein